MKSLLTAKTKDYSQLNKMFSVPDGFASKPDREVPGGLVSFTPGFSQVPGRRN
jgi:hypothetical protein